MCESGNLLLHFMLVSLQLMNFVQFLSFFSPNLYFGVHSLFFYLSVFYFGIWLISNVVIVSDGQQKTQSYTHMGHSPQNSPPIQAAT